MSSTTPYKPLPGIKNRTQRQKSQDSKMASTTDEDDSNIRLEDELNVVLNKDTVDDVETELDTRIRTLRDNNDFTTKVLTL